MQELPLQLVVTADVAADYARYLPILYHKPKAKVVGTSLVADYNMISSFSSRKRPYDIFWYSNQAKPTKKWKKGEAAEPTETANAE